MRKIAGTLAALSLLAAAPAVAQPEPFDFMDLEGMGPREIGERALEGLEHQQIVEIEYQNEGMRPPGFHQVTLLEMPERLESGCLRRGWLLHFSNHPAFEDGGSGLDFNGRTPQDQVALSGPIPCQFASFTRLYSNVPPAEGLSLLRDLAEFGEADRGYICEDRTPSHLCRNAQSVRNALRYLAAWYLKYDEEGRAVFWLGERGEVVTEVIIPRNPDAPWIIERRVPPPF